MLADDPLLSVSTSFCLTALGWRVARWQEIVQRMLQAHCALFNYMRKDHRRAHILVSE